MPRLRQRAQRLREIDADLGAADRDQRHAGARAAPAPAPGSAPWRCSIQVGASPAVAISFAVRRVRRWLSATTRTSGVGPEAGEAAGEHRVVGLHRAGAHHHGVVAPAQHMRGAARGGAGDPLALAPPRRDAAVERGGELERDERPALAHAAHEARPRPPPPPPRARPRPPRPRRRAAARCPARPRAGRDRGWRSPRGRCPASISASAQGGVRPQWQQGSSVT